MTATALFVNTPATTTEERRAAGALAMELGSRAIVQDPAGRGWAFVFADEATMHRFANIAAVRLPLVEIVAGY